MILCSCRQGLKTTEGPPRLEGLLGGPEPPELAIGAACSAVTCGFSSSYFAMTLSRLNKSLNS